MRALWISMTLFFLMLGMIAVSVWMLADTRAMFTKTLSQLPPEAGKQACEVLQPLRMAWQNRCGWLRLLLHRERWRALEEQLGILADCAAMGEEAQVEYEIARGALWRAVEEMARVGDALFFCKNVDRSTFLCYNSAVPQGFPCRRCRFCTP